MFFFNFLYALVYKNGTHILRLRKKIPEAHTILLYVTSLLFSEWREVKARKITTKI